MLLSFTNAEGDSLEVACLVATGHVAVDVFNVHRDDLGQFIPALCMTWSS
jgi:hypothetical protein